MTPLKVLFTTAEATPFAKIGGLADVSQALPQALVALGHDARVVLPLYPGVREKATDLEDVTGDTPILVPTAHRRYACRIARATFPGSQVHAHFIDCPELYERGSIYTQDDDEHVRFVVLTRAALELAQRWQWAPDVAHAHDWHTALQPLYLKTAYAWDRLFERTRSLLTIHNLGHQGVFSSLVVGDLALGEGARLLPGEDIAAGRVNFLKAGLVHADQLSTVSPTYAREIQTEAFGFGLSGLLSARRDALTGILNGIDDAAWNPLTDPLVPAHYSARSLARKERNKQVLLESVGLPYVKGVPTLGIVTRLSAQKGIDLLMGALPGLLAQWDLRFVALGSGEWRYESFLRDLQHAFPDRVRYWQGFNDKLAHLIEAGADMFLMPSQYEPCGLNQMYSLRYGTPPVARRTGGLADTVEPYDPANAAGTGFVFDHYTSEGLRWALDQALTAYGDKPNWTALQKRGMAKDFGWAASAARYVDLYRAMTGVGAGEPSPSSSAAARP
jgi:starch synthase